MNLKKEIELAAGGGIAAITWAMDHYNAIVGSAIGTLALFVWAMKARRAWKHRNDPEDKDSGI